MLAGLVRSGAGSSEYAAEMMTTRVKLAAVQKLRGRNVDMRGTFQRRVDEIILDVLVRSMLRAAVDRALASFTRGQ